jgi:uncharacterized damage-inducible protein DinB
MVDLEQARYPVGRFERCTGPPDAGTRAALVDVIEQTPRTIRGLVERLTDAQLETPYRDGGWTIRQVVHHVPDSHMHAYARMKFAITEDTPAIKAYDEGQWAELPDARSAPVAVSLDLLESLHGRWVLFLRHLPDEAFLRAYVHPELGRVPLYEVVAHYAWHGRHHAAHIEMARRRVIR